MIMALFRPHEGMRVGRCLPVGSCTCRAYPPPRPGPMDTPEFTNEAQRRIRPLNHVPDRSQLTNGAGFPTCVTRVIDAATTAYQILQRIRMMPKRLAMSHAH